MATKDRVYIDQDFVALADRLVKRQIPGSQSVQGVFRDTRELMVFAASLGFRRKRFQVISKNGREVKLSAIERIDIGGVDFLGAIAVAHTSGVAILAPDLSAERAEILEGYANGGLAYIAGIADENQPALEVLAALVKSEHAPDQSQADVLDLFSQRL